MKIKLHVSANNLQITWQMNRKTHRENNPAVIHSDGYKAWYLRGKFIRHDGPHGFYERLS